MEQSAKNLASHRPSRSTYNILMIAPTSFFADYGCHVRILEEAQILQQMGNQVTICTYYMGRDMEGLDIRRTLPIPWRTHYEVGSSRHKFAFDMLLTFKTLSVALRSMPRPDVVHGHLHEGALMGSTVSKLLGIPLIFDFQGSLTSEMIDHHFLNPNGSFYRPMRWLEEQIVKLPSTIITSSQHAADILHQDFPCAKCRITPIPDCVNADHFAPAQYRQSSAELKVSWGIPADQQVVVYLGLLAEWQGTGLLLQAAQQVLTRRPNTHFMIMGYPSVEFYKQQAAALGLDNHVTFTGKIPYEQVPAYLSLGDVAVAPKISATEGSGKLLNYMAMGLPTVAFDVPVSREYLDASGIYARPRDAQSLSVALETALGESVQSATPWQSPRGQALRQRAIDHYSWTTAGQKIMDIYDAVCQR